MNIRVIAVGRVKEKYLSQGIAEYTKRLRAYGKIDLVELKEESFHEPLNEKEIENILNKEGERILSEMDQKSFNIVMDRQGDMLSSEAFAELFLDTALHGTSSFNVVIGGSLGLSAGVKQKADLLMSFSKLTFPHQLMRLVVFEQIYRAMTINRGEKYHK